MRRSRLDRPGETARCWKSAGCNFPMGCRAQGLMAGHSLARVLHVRPQALPVGLGKLDGPDVPDVDQKDKEDDWPASGAALSSDDEAFIARLVQSGAIANERASAHSAAQGMRGSRCCHTVLLLHRLCHMTKVRRWVGGKHWATLSRGATRKESVSKASADRCKEERTRELGGGLVLVLQSARACWMAVLHGWGRRSELLRLRDDVNVLCYRMSNGAYSSISP